MTRDDIIRMAKEAGWRRTGRNPETGPEFPVLIDRLERFAVLVAAAEREACVKIWADEKPELIAATYMVNPDWIIEKIRARGKE